MPDFGISKGAARALRKEFRRGAADAVVGREEQLGKLYKTEADAPATPAGLTKPVAEAPVEPAGVADAVEAPLQEVRPPREAYNLQFENDAALEAEARRLADVSLDDYKLDETFQTNFDTIETTDGIKGIIADVAQNNAGRIDEARRGTIAWEQLRALSDDLDIDADVVQKVMEREAGGILNAETILAARQVLNSSADRIHTLSKKIAAGEADDFDRLTFRRQLQWHNEYQTQFMGARAEAGRALNAFRIPTDAQSVDISHIREMIDAADGHSTDTIARAIALMDDPRQIHSAARKYTQSKVMGVVNELFINSILSGPKTHLINTFGNTLFQTMNIAETAIASRIGRFLSGDEHVLVGEASAMMHGVVNAWRDGFRLFAKTLKTGIALDDVVKFESTRRRSISAEHLLSPEQRNTPIGRFVDILGAGVRAPTERVMAPTDEFFKTLAYRSEMERQAFLHAVEQVQSGARRANEVAQITREFMENPQNTITKLADDYTRYVTFQNPLGEMGQKAQLALRSAPALSLIAPFIRTPVNIFKAGIMDRSPIALFTKQFWNTMKKGGRERDMMLARVGMGTATSAVIATMAADGSITGAGPSNPEARAVLEADGWQPYSLRVGDEYISYARAEPLAFVIGATADAVEVMSYVNSDVEGLETEAEQMNNAAAAIIIGIANNTLSKTYMQGISDFVEMMSDPKRYFPGWARGMTTAMIPYSAFRSQMGQIQDPYLREAWTLTDAVRAKSGIPGLSEDLPFRRDIFGQERKGWRGDLMGPMSPFPVKQISSDPVTGELRYLMEATRRVPVSMPGKRVNGMQLTAAEYEELVLISRTEAHPLTKRTFHEELSRMINNSQYIKATPDMQVELIKDMQSRYDDFARATLQKRNPEFALRLEDFQQRRDALYGRQ